jgi:hypothetical protein
MTKWSKEDRNHYNNSEVIREYEKMILEKYNALVKMQENMNLNKEAQDSKLNQVTTDAANATKAIEGLGQAVNKLNLADDMEEAVEEEAESKSEEDIFNETIEHLNDLAEIAEAEDDTVSLYEIERTIQELKDSRYEQEE